MNNKVIAIILLVVGAGFAYWGYEMSGAIGAQLSKSFTGSATDGVMIRYIAGLVCIGLGLFFLLKRK